MQQKDGEAQQVGAGQQLLGSENAPQNIDLKDADGSMLTKLLLSQQLGGQGTVALPDLAQSVNSTCEGVAGSSCYHEETMKEILAKIGIQYLAVKEPCSNTQQAGTSCPEILRNIETKLTELLHGKEAVQSPTIPAPQNIESKLDELLKEKEEGSQTTALPTSPPDIGQVVLPTLPAQSVLEMCKQQHQIGINPENGRPYPVHPVNPLLDPDNPCRLVNHLPGASMADLIQVMDLKARAAESGEGIQAISPKVLKNIFIIYHFSRTFESFLSNRRFDVDTTLYRHQVATTLCVYWVKNIIILILLLFLILTFLHINCLAIVDGHCFVAIDIGIVLDISRAAYDHWLQIQSYLHQLIKHFEVGGISRIGIITFSNEARIEIPFGAILGRPGLFKSDSTYLERISQIHADPNGFTRRTDLALNKAMELFRGGRRQVPKALILLEHGGIIGKILNPNFMMSKC